jgi:hypothetical protein
VTRNPPKFELARLANTFEAFGMVIDLLSRHEPFMRFDLGQLGAAVRLQLRHEHHVAALAGKALVGYVGWLPTTSEAAEAWLDDRGPLHPILDREVDGFAVTIVLTVDSSITRPIVRAARYRNAGKRAFFKRITLADATASRKNSVLSSGPTTSDAA